MSIASDMAPAARASVERGADKIRVLRVGQGFSRRELASRAGMSVNTLTGIENDHQRPSLERARGLSDALGVELEELFAVCECACGCGGLLIDQARHGSSARFLSGHNCRQPEHGASVKRGHQARRARLGIPEEKTCIGCGKTYTRSDVPNQSDAHWLSRQFCPGGCRWPVRAQERRCEHCGELIPREVMSKNRHRRFHCRRCGQLNRFARGDVAPEFVEQMPGRARQRWVGRWEGRKFGRLGGRPAPMLTADQRVAVETLKAQGWGRRAIADRLGLSERAVRNVLAP